MPEDVKDRLHDMARRAKADQGLSFTDSTGTDLDKLYPDDDTDDDYDPNDDDDQSYNSDQSSAASYSNTLDGETDTPDAVPASPPATIIQTPTMTLRPPISGNHPNIDRTPITATPPRTTGDTGVGGGDLESYVDRLEAQLDDEIYGLDTTHDTDNDSQQSDSVDHDANDTNNEENSTINDNAPDDVSDGAVFLVVSVGSVMIDTVGLLIVIACIVRRVESSYFIIELCFQPAHVTL